MSCSGHSDGVGFTFELLQTFELLTTFERVRLENVFGPLKVNQVGDRLFFFSLKRRSLLWLIRCNLSAEHILYAVTALELKLKYILRIKNIQDVLDLRVIINLFLFEPF